jgi:hypothetical protein
LVPPQIVLPGFAEILTDGTTDAVTVIVIVFDDALVGLAHASDDVITQLTWSPFTNPAFVYWLLFEPTLLPFNFH